MKQESRRITWCLQHLEHKRRIIRQGILHNTVFFMFSRINGVENRGGKMTPRGGCDTENGLGPSVLVWEGLTSTRCSSSVGSSQTPCVCYTDMDRCRWSQTVPLVPDASRGPVRWIRLRKRVWTIGTGLWGSPDRTSSVDTLYELKSSYIRPYKLPLS